MRARFRMPRALIALATAALAACTSAAPPSTATSPVSSRPAPTASPQVMPPRATSKPATPSPAAPSPLFAGTVAMDDAGCHYEGPATITAGSVVLVLDNGTGVQFDADLWLLKPGHVYDELAASIAKGREALLKGLLGGGHPTFARLVAEATATGTVGELTAKVARGTYGVACIRFEGGRPVDMWSAGPITVID